MNITDPLAADMALHGYQVLRLLGKGGAGTVFEARQTSTGQTVAIKMLRQDSEPDPLRKLRLVERFERETHLCAQLQHPHIVKLLDKGLTQAGRPDGPPQLFAVFEYVPGETLKDLLLRKGALSALAAGELMGQVLDALVAAHAQGIVHRDLKPQNVMVMRTGARPNVKVLDFGIAAFIPEHQMADYRNLTVTHETMCSPSYSAPEQLRGEPPTLKTDLYAWGLLFLECLTGRPAIQGATLAEIFHKQLSAAEVPIPVGLADHPLADLLRRVLRKSAPERAEGTAALYEDFQQINLANIVGDLHAHLQDASDASPPDGQMGAATRPSLSGWHGMGDDRQQITVLSCRLALWATAASETGLDALDALQRDQLNLCIDTAARFGGHLAGSMGNSLMFYYGYPQVSDTDARRCARSALELVGQVRRRGAFLARRHGCGLAIRVAIHTGIVRVRQAYLPSGVTPDIAFQLAQRADAGAVLVSAPARRLLEQFMEFEGGGECVLEGSGETLRYSALVGEFCAEAVSFLRAGMQGGSLVGRTAELATLSAAWQAASAKRGGAALLQGEAGIGKSRLSGELGLMARRQGAVCKECRCLPECQNNALHPILDMLKTHLQLHQAGDAPEAQLAEHAQQQAGAVARLSAALADAGCAVEAALPIFCSWLGLPVPAQFPMQQFTPGRQKMILLDALQNLLLHLCRERPLLLLVEDLHWIDQTSVELLTQLINALPPHALLVLMTARPGFVAPWEAGQVAVLRIGRLAQREAEQLVRKILGGKPIDPAALSQLCDRTDGIPLFVEELTRMLQENKLLTERHGVFCLDERFGGTAVPATLRDLLSARLQRLGPARESAQLAAAIGREFDYGLLAEIALCDAGTLQNDLDQLVAADLVIRQRRVQGDSYIFRHALLRDAAYDSMPKNVREQTHARIAQQIESGFGTSVEQDLSQMARHFALATQYGGAVRYGNQAAQVLVERALHDDALKLLELVKQWIDELPPDQQRAAQIDTNRIVLNALATKYGHGVPAVKEQAEILLNLLEGSADVQQTVHAMIMLVLCHHYAGRRALVRSLMPRLFALAEQANDKSSLVFCRMVNGHALWAEGDLAAAALSLNQVLRDYDHVRDANCGHRFGFDCRVYAQASLGVMGMFVDGDETVAYAAVHAAVAHARQLNHIPTLWSALLYLAFLHLLAGDAGGALSACAEIQALGQKYGMTLGSMYANALHGCASNDLVRAEHALADLIKIQGLATSIISYIMVGIEARNGNHEAALRRCDDVLVRCKKQGPWLRPMVLVQRARYRLAMQSGDHGAMRADLLEAIALAGASGMTRAVREAQAQLDTMALLAAAA